MLNIFKTLRSWVHRPKPVFDPPRWGTVERWRHEKEVGRKQQLVIDAAKVQFRDEREIEAEYRRSQARYREMKKAR